MKSRILTCVIAMTLLVAMAVPVRLAAQSKYRVVELGELGGTAGSANGINDRFHLDAPLFHESQLTVKTARTQTD